jgi:hypothetical protein
MGAEKPSHTLMAMVALGVGGCGIEAAIAGRRGRRCTLAGAASPCSCETRPRLHPSHMHSLARSLLQIVYGAARRACVLRLAPGGVHTGSCSSEIPCLLSDAALDGERVSNPLRGIPPPKQNAPRSPDTAAWR